MAAKYSYPHAAYISTWNVEFSEISVFSPIGDKADWIAGPRTNPNVWNRDNKEMCVNLSLGFVAFATYNRFGAMLANKIKKNIEKYFS